MSNGSDGKPTIGGRYEVDGLLGRGGMAEVRKGTDTRLGRVVAIKACAPTWPATRPSRPASAGRRSPPPRSTTPAIVSVYDTGEEVGTEADGIGSDGVPQPYIVMEYVAGRTLREIPRRPQDPPGAGAGDHLRRAVRPRLQPPRRHRCTATSSPPT